MKIIKTKQYIVILHHEETILSALSTQIENYFNQLNVELEDEEESHSALRLIYPDPSYNVLWYLMRF
ncbi:hypothetical protein [Paenibacillus xylanexedens]|uniref:hypothetical protein n=1 Tax=Paenibacillus xylanexedens TaxID=528191 RepID=UPI0011A327AA|nr:hypothetical protein [Paenibacillus xylanexedens]